jgi:RNA polymerase sigma-70 factor (ECF subfamily)
MSAMPMSAAHPDVLPVVLAHTGGTPHRDKDALVAADDDALMLQVGRGDPHAYRQLSDRYLASIVRYATRMLGHQAEAEDVAQETFLRLWRDAGRYESRGHKPSTWLYRIAHNLCIDRLRQRRPESAAPDDELASDRTSAPLIARELSEHVSAALASLPERQRAAIALVHYEEKSLEEAGLVLGCAASAVESLLARGRRSLREQLAAFYRDGDGR